MQFLNRNGFFLLKYYIMILVSLGLYKSSNAQIIPDLVFVQIPDQNKYEYTIGNISTIKSDRYIANSRIVTLRSSSSNPTNLTPEFYSACDPDVSFDGKSIIFAGKKTEKDRWQIWRMNIDGSHKQQISHSKSDCITPVHAGSRFYLNDPKPTPQIIYTGMTDGWENVQDSESIFALYGMDLEGESLHQLTFNLHSDFSPEVLPNGRIVFISWQSHLYQNGSMGKYTLMAINNDGTDLMPFYGNHETPIYRDMVHISISDPRIYFIESERLSWLGGGDICYLSQERPLHSYKVLNHEEDGLFHSPCPLQDNNLLASYRSLSQPEEFALYLIDPATGDKLKKIYEESGWHCIDTHILQPHPKVKGRSNWLIPGSETGVFYCLDSYRTNLQDLGKIEPGSIKYVRILEGIPFEKNLNIPDDNFNINSISDVESPSHSIYGSTRILGTTPVEKDGSFQIRVPSDIPLKFQLLDKNYLAVRSQETWTWVMGNENRGCIGCHEDPELSPPNIMVDAVVKPPVDLTKPPEQRQKIDFIHQIVPIIESKCATDNCHASGMTKPSFAGVKNDANKQEILQIYTTLVNPVQDRQNERYVVPGHAIESPLIWHIIGEQMYRDKFVHMTNIKTLPVNNLLTVDEKILFIEWIDLGAFWDYPQ
jgi:hypothetical protein